MVRATALRTSQPRAATNAGPSTSKNIPGEKLVDFHLFADLAAELQDSIWELSCYSNPETIPIYISRHIFKFQLRKAPAVPSVLHATSGARAIGLRHFCLVKFEVQKRNPPRVQVLLGGAALSQQIQAHATLNHLASMNAIQANLGHGWTVAFPVTQPALPAPTPQGSNTLSMVPLNAQTSVQAQHNSNGLGAVHQQNQQNIQAQGLLPPSTQNQVVQSSTNSGGPQQTAGQGVGLQNNAQHVSHQQAQGSGILSTFSNFVSHYQTFFGGSLQTAAAVFAQYQSPHGGTMTGNAVGQSTSTQNGAQQQSMLGANFQAAPISQQNTNQTSQQLSTFGGSWSIPAGQQLVNPGTTLQLNNPAATVNTALGNLLSVANAVAQRNQPLLVDADDSTDDESDRYFYVNSRSDCCMLKVGLSAGCNYPTYNLMRFPQTLNAVSDEDRQAYLRRTQRLYSFPTQFPAPGRLPSFLAKLCHLIIRLELAPCHAPMRSDGFKNWLQIQTKTFCEQVIKSTLKRFQSVKHLDLLIAEAAHSRQSHTQDQMVYRHFRQAPISDEDGITFGHAELGLLESEIRLWMMSEYMGENGCEGPEVRIVVHVPKYS